MFPTTHTFTFATAAPPWDVWLALTDADTTARWLDGPSLVSTWKPRSPLEVRLGDVVVGHGEVLAADAWDRVAFALDGGTGADTYVTWSIRNIPTGSLVQLHVDELDADRDDEVESAWMPILRRLQGVLSDGAGVDRTAAG